jgi:hypothetical protein
MNKDKDRQKKKEEKQNEERINKGMKERNNRG